MPQVTEYQMAFISIKDDELTPCPAEMSEGETDAGQMLDDLVVIAAIAATCIKKQKSLIDYLQPIVEKARAAYSLSR